MALPGKNHPETDRVFDVFESSPVLEIRVMIVRADAIEMANLLPIRTRAKVRGRDQAVHQEQTA